MKQTLFAIACLASMATARHEREMRGTTGRSGGNSNNAEFANWVSNNGKSFTTTSEYQTRQSNWEANDAIINAKNAQRGSDPNGVVLKHNGWSDLSRDEQVAKLGIAQVNQDAKAHGKTAEPKQEYRSDQNINWHTAGGTGGPNQEAYDQVYDMCNSGYAFTAARVFEGTVFAQNGEYERTSEQQIISCSKWIDNQGCTDGAVVNSWYHLYFEGTRSHADYPYRSGNYGYDYRCKETQYDRIASGAWVDDWVYYTNEPVEVLRDALHDGPLSIQVKADVEDFMFYADGVLRQADCQAGSYWDLNHFVTLVGYHEADPLPVDPVDPDNGDQVVMDDLIIDTTVTTRARLQLAEDILAPGGCRFEGEKLVEDGYCAKTTVTIVEELPARRLQAADYETYWTVLNSWGPYWGINGTAKFEVSQDVANGGTCGMHHWAQSVVVGFY